MFQAGVMIKTVACDLMKASSKCWLYALAVSLLSFQKSLKSLKLGGVIRGWFWTWLIAVIPAFCVRHKHENENEFGREARGQSAIAEVE